MIVVSDPTGWPPIGHETLPWRQDDVHLASRTARRRYVGPYQAAIPPTIATARLSLPSRVTSLTEDAATEIARFDADLGHELAPFSAVLLRTESAASSRIENLTASARAIAEAELAPFGASNAALIVANTSAMTAAVDLAEHIDKDTILAMHRALLGRSQPEIAGRWRDDQVWIGGHALGPHDALFVPPHQHRLQSAIDDLIVYVERNDVPVLAHAAIVHAQFETIHPFADGNGRTGRALLHAQLRNKGLTRNVTIPLSAGLLTDTDGYFDALTAYRAGNPVPIVEQVATASFSALTNGRQLVGELRTARSSWDDRLKIRRDAAARRALDVLVRHPVVDVALLAGKLGIARQNTYRVLEPLAAAGIVVEFTDKRRNQLWRAPDVLNALDAFAARAGRRDRRRG